jgi:signal transduction histidine kinase
LAFTTIIFPMVAATCLTLAAVHVMVWLQARDSRDSLMFSVAAAAAAATVLLELFLLHSRTPETYGVVLRWMHLPVATVVIALMWFLRLYLKAGRTWLIWLVTTLRLMVLLVNFIHSPNATFTDITGLHEFVFLGESVSVPEGVQSPWRLVSGLSNVLFIGYTLDASFQARRKRTRPRPLFLGGVVVCAALFTQVFANLMARGILPAPFIGIGFLVILLPVAVELGVDLSRVRNLARELRDSRERMRMASRAANLRLWEWDIGRDRIWSYFNGTERDGDSFPEPLTFDRFLQTIHHDDREAVQGLFDRAISGDSDIDAEFRIVRPDGQVRWIAVCGGQQEHDMSGPPHSLYGVSRDITERKLIAAELQQQRNQLSHIQRVAATEQLSAVLAHEINQPLGAILRNVEAAELLLQNESPDIDEVRDIITDVKLDVRRAALVIEGLGSLMKRQEFAVEALPITDIINSTAELLRAVVEDRQATLHVDLQPGLPWISGDRIHLQQVLLNLMMNGLEAMDRMTHGEKTLVVRASQPRQGIVEVAVIDRGLGIPPAELPNLFEPFHTTKATGLGIGLAISRTIIELHDGRLWGENNPEGGAIFRFTLRPTELGDES